MKSTSIMAFTAVLLLAPCKLTAQTAPTGPTSVSDDFGVDLTVGLEKKIATGLSAEIEGNFRSQDNTNRAERWLVGAGLSYRLYRSADKRFNLKANAGFEYMWKHKLGGITEHFSEGGDLNGYNQTECFWRDRHRTSLGATMSFKPSKRWTFQLKETMQYNHLSADSTVRYKWRYNDDDELYVRQDNKIYTPKDRFVLRSKLTVEYNIKGLPLNPYASVDYGAGVNYTANKWKLTAGMDFNIDKQQKITMFYRFQHENDGEEPNGHLVGLGYKIDL